MFKAFQSMHILITGFNHTKNNFAGPKLPINFNSSFCASTMVTSPTGKGVVLIGGKTGRTYQSLKYFNNMYELSGNSIEDLKWSVLDQKLKFERSAHVSFAIPNEICDDFKSETCTNASINTEIENLKRELSQMKDITEIKENENKKLKQELMEIKKRT